MFSRTPVAVLAGMALAGSVLVAPGVSAAPTAGRAAAWGSNGSGQLGNDSTTSSEVPVPVHTGTVLAGKTITTISAGSQHTCAVGGGRAYCWGFNGAGQLGNDSTLDSGVPVAVMADSGPLAGKTVTAISAGGNHTCALADGEVFCWGHNYYGQLGDGTTNVSELPVAVNTSGPLAGKTVTAITAGDYHSCAVADQKAYCWGHNSNGQLGNNSTTDSLVPVPVYTTGPLDGKIVTAMTAGILHTCAVAEGKAYCWGHNNAGQLGNNSTTDSKVPVAVEADSGVLSGKPVTMVTSRSDHTCVVADGEAYCWGYNGSGQLGDETTTNSSVPVAVDTTGPLAGKAVTAIAAGVSHTCAVSGGRALCWGYNGDGQLGNNSTPGSGTPVGVDTSGVLDGQTVTAITAGTYHSAVLAASVPQPPTAVNGAPADGQVSVSWTPPADSGGSPVLDYTATAVPGGATCTSSGTSCVVFGLTNGTGYTFTVTARNAIGVSAPSAPSAPVTPTSPPVPPVLVAPGTVTGVKAVVKKGKVKITWKVVPAATSYRARISKPGGTKYKAWKTTSKRVFKATVRKGKKYRFQIAAVAAGGRGPVTTIRFKGK